MDTPTTWPLALQLLVASSPFVCGAALLWLAIWLDKRHSKQPPKQPPKRFPVKPFDLDDPHVIMWASSDLYDDDF